MRARTALTITVYRVRPDGTRTPPTARILVPDSVRDSERLPAGLGYPPCRCPRCR
ncbi:hypothetical protein [Streptomyces sp. ODS28]|uniref:hypothetical protein n=1 Tax=Streptomyces sp. ODS28 TaxID=3136688 RepID=UPI0031F19855